MGAVATTTDAMLAASMASLKISIERMKEVAERSTSTDATLARVARLQASWESRGQVVQGSTTAMPLPATPTVASLNLSLGRATASTTVAHKVFDALSTPKEVTMSNVIHVSVSHMTYPVTKAVLRQVFEMYGYGVIMMTMIQGSSWADAYVQLRSGHEAVRARDALHGRNIYEGCCDMSIECKPVFAPSTTAAPSLAMGPNSTSTTSNTVAAPTLLGTSAAAQAKHSTGSASMCTKVFTEMPSSPMPRADVKVFQPTAAQTSATTRVQSTAMSFVTETTAATPVIVDEVVTSPLCHEKVQQHCSLEVFPEAHRMEIEDDSVLTDIGGLSLFLELVVESADGIVMKSNVNDVMCNEEPPYESGTYTQKIMWCDVSLGDIAHMVEPLAKECSHDVLTCVGSSFSFLQQVSNVADKLLDTLLLEDVSRSEAVSTYNQNIFDPGIITASAEGSVLELSSPLQCHGYSPGSTIEKPEHQLYGSSRDPLYVLGDPRVLHIILCGTSGWKVTYSASHLWDPGISPHILEVHLLGILQLFDLCVVGSAFRQQLLLFESGTEGVRLTLPWDPGACCSLEIVARNIEYMLVRRRNSDVVLDGTSFWPLGVNMWCFEADKLSFFLCPILNEALQAGHAYVWEDIKPKLHTPKSELIWPIKQILMPWDPGEKHHVMSCTRPVQLAGVLPVSRPWDPGNVPEDSATGEGWEVLKTCFPSVLAWGQASVPGGEYCHALAVRCHCRSQRRDNVLAV